MSQQNVVFHYKNFNSSFGKSTYNYFVNVIVFCNNRNKESY